MVMAAKPAIHPTAIVDRAAEIESSVRIGPYCVVGSEVRLHAGVTLHSHVVLQGRTTLHEQVEVYPFAALGLPPQDLKYDGRPTTLEVGARTIVREGATLHRGSSGSDGGVTTVGSDGLLMAYVHVAHDCRVGNHVVVANATQLAGYVSVEDHVVLGGVTTVHQFVRIGMRAITGASSRVQQDIPPFSMADGHPARVVGLNRLGLERGRVTPDAHRALKRAFRALFREGRYSSALEELERGPLMEHAEIRRLCSFLRTSRRGIARPRG